MTLQPVLANAHVRLDPLVPEDYPALFAVASDPAIWAQHPAQDRWQAGVFRAFFDEALASHGALAARDAQTGAVIGSSRYCTARAAAGEVEIGWTFLARSHWGGAANAAMKALMIGHALTHYDSVIFLIGESNLRSRRATEKIGGILTDRTLTVAMAGASVRHVVYSIDRPGFASGPLADLAEAIPPLPGPMAPFTKSQ
jgi:RimJ/RimL family protein N-acetyltransferase